MGRISHCIVIIESIFGYVYIIQKTCNSVADALEPRALPVQMYLDIYGPNITSNTIRCRYCAVQYGVLPEGTKQLPESKLTFDL